MDFNSSVKFNNFQTQALSKADIIEQNKEQSLNLETKPDEFVHESDLEETEVSNERKTQKNNFTKKIPLAWAVVLGGIATAAIFLYRKQSTTKVAQLAQSIKFKKAATAQEAIEYGKQNLGIKKYAGFEEKDVDVLNWINEGLTNVSNTMHGNLRMPKKIVNSTELDDNALAAVMPYSLKSIFSGSFDVNKKVFSNIDEFIKRIIKKCTDASECLIKSDDGTYKAASHFFDTENTAKMIEQIKTFENGNLTNFNDKIALYETLHKYQELPTIILKSPFIKIEQIVKTLEKQGFKVKLNLDAIKQKSIDEQRNILAQLIKSTKNKTGQSVAFAALEKSPFSTIYHEMGHLQDMVSRVEPTVHFKSPEKYPEELKKWLNNSLDIQTANNISLYAATGPGEFIAETFAAIVEHGKVPDSAMQLYNKLNGPKILP